MNDLEPCRELAGLSQSVRMFPASSGDMTAFFSDLAQAQSEFAPIINNREGKALDSFGNEHTYFYADLDAVISATRPALNQHGFSLLQIPTGTPEGASLLSIFAHKTGARIESVISIERGLHDQDFGGKITLIRRYVMLGLIGATTADSMEGPAVNRTSAGAAESLPPSDIPAEVLKEMQSAKTIMQLSRAFNRLPVDLRKKPGNIAVFEKLQRALGDAVEA